MCPEMTPKSLSNFSTSTSSQKKFLFNNKKCEDIINTKELLLEKNVALEPIEILNDFSYEPDEEEFCESELSSCFSSSIFTNSCFSKRSSMFS